MSSLILIAGGSAAGKSFIGKLIADKYKNLSVSVLSHDNYYKDVSNLSEKELSEYNFDHPDAIDSSLLFKDISALLERKQVEIPSYDFITHKRKEHQIIVPESDIIILEGIFALYFKELINISSMSVFVDTDSDIRLARRIKRDVAQRGFSVESVIDNYLSVVKPMHDTFIEPSKKNADIIIPGEKSFDKVMKMLDGYFVNTIIENFRK